jgi:parallel beta-helix repeat protein
MKRISWAAIAVAVGIVSFSALGSLSQPASATSTRVVDDDGQGSAGNCDSTDTAYSTIQAAIADATADDTISVCPGTYVESGQIVISKNLSLAGAGASTTVVKPAGDTGSSGNARGWFLVNSGITFNLSGVTLDGTGRKVFQAIRHLGRGTISDCAFSNIKYPGYNGTGIAAMGPTGMNVDVTNCTFTEIGRIGVIYYGVGVTGTFSGNTYTGKGSGDWLDYGVEVGAGAHAAISNSTISNCLGVASSDGSVSGGVLVSTYYGAGTQASITGNTFTNNYWGIGVGYGPTDTSVVVAHLNNISGNTHLGLRSSNPTVDATGNWWGSDSGPTHTLNPGGSGDAVSDKVAYSPWLGIGDTSGDPGFQPASPMTFIVGPQVCLPVGCIQQGVNLASNDDTINVHDGTYDGFKIDSKDNLTVVAASSPVVSGDKVSLPDGSKALVAVQNSNGVTIDGLTVDASGYLENHFSGVIYYGSSGTIQNSTIQNIEGTGGQARAGIRAQDGSSLAILDNTISEYDKAGIVSRSMDSIDIERNDITTTYHGTAPNGIDIGTYHGTSATIKDNEISGADYDQFDAGEYETEWSGAAILIIEAGDSLEISGNTVFNNDVALDIESDSATVTGNDLSSNLYGIVLWNSNPVMKLNSIAGNTSYGVYRTSDQTGIADATSNWWGDVTGPYHATINPLGLGDNVSNNVLFDPWVKAIEYVGDTSIPSGSTANLRARFLNSSGTTPLVAGVTVHFDLLDSLATPVPGSPFSALTDGSGVASVPVTGLGIGLYTVTARWDPLEDSTNLTVSGTGDSDGDGVPDTLDNCPAVYNPDQKNSDGGRRPNGSQIPGAWASNPAQDKLGDACDPDDDNDALPDTSENELVCPFRLVGNSDGDRVLDGFEVATGYNPCSDASKPRWEGGGDSDGDGFPDGVERTGYNTCIFAGDSFPGYTACINPEDSDGDGCADWIEINDLDGNRTVDSGDSLFVAKRFANWIPADLVSDPIFDVDKNGKIDSGDMLAVAKNNCMLRRNDGGCPRCPAE